MDKGPHRKVRAFACLKGGESEQKEDKKPCVPRRESAGNPDKNDLEDHIHVKLSL